MKARRAHLEVTYQGVDITEDLRPHLKGWSYTDNISGQADDLQITLEDRDELWIGDWLPDDGDSITGKVVREHWEQEGQTEELPLGRFDIDEIDGNLKPSTVTLRGVSVPGASSLRGEKKNRAWEKTQLSVIAGDKANEAGLKLIYDTDDDPEYDRIEQAGESDLSYLMRLCTDAGLCLKVSDAQLVIFDERKYEEQDPITTIVKGESGATVNGFRKTLSGTYRSCKVEYHDPNKGTTIRYTFTPPNPPHTGRVLVINDRVASVKEAERLAKKRLREANKNAWTFNLTVIGDTRYLAGLTVSLQGFGRFDGKYIITQAVHGQQSKYETQLQLRRVLEGY